MFVLEAATVIDVLTNQFFPTIPDVPQPARHADGAQAF
jgi:hypothetical protein